MSADGGASGSAGARRPQGASPAAGITGLLRGHQVLVTGAGSGIGAAVARLCAQAGAGVARIDLHGAPGIQQCDVRDEQEVIAAFAATERPFSDVVHCAGIAESAPIEETSLADWQRILETNLTGSFLIAREATRRLAAPGTITFIASVGGLKGFAEWSAYGASKFGVVGLMRSLAQELAPRGVRVNAICPGGVRTPMVDQTVAEEAARTGVPVEAIFAKEDEVVPLGRMAEPDEIASVCCFLMSDLARHVAGAMLPVDGGQLA